MWYTPKGDRKLQGRERALFVAGVVGLYEHLIDEDMWDDNDGGPHTGVPVFDAIPIDARPYVLLHVAQQMLSDGESPELYAWNEGTIRAVFAFVESMCELEDEDSETEAASGRFHRLVREAWEEVESRHAKEGPVDTELEDGEGIELPGKNDFTRMLDELMLDIFWDDDFLDDVLPDVEPKHGKELKATMGIQEDYYTSVPKAVSKEDRRRLDAFLSELERELG
jgi:hypothetical protein